MAVTVNPPDMLSMNVAGRVGLPSPTPSAPSLAFRVESGVAVSVTCSPLRSTNSSTGLSRFSLMSAMAALISATFCPLMASKISPAWISACCAGEFSATESILYGALHGHAL